MNYLHYQVNGEPRKQHYEGKWDALIKKCTRCLQDWLRLASQRRRNYIIDQVSLEKSDFGYLTACPVMNNTRSI